MEEKWIKGWGGKKVGGEEGLGKEERERILQLGCKIKIMKLKNYPISLESFIVCVCVGAHDHIHAYED